MTALPSPTTRFLLFFLLPFVLAFSSLQAASEESGKVTLLRGAVRVIAPDGTEASLRRGNTVVVGSTIITGSNARAVIVMTGISAVRIGENSEVVLERMEDNGDSNADAALVNLKSGSVSALINSTETKKIDFRIQTPQAVATARGTYYAVAIHEGKTFTQVEHGVVNVVPTTTGEE